MSPVGDESVFQTAFFRTVRVERRVGLLKNQNASAVIQKAGKRIPVDGRRKGVPFDNQHVNSGGNSFFERDGNTANSRFLRQFFRFDGGNTDFLRAVEFRFPVFREQRQIQAFGPSVGIEEQLRRSLAADLRQTELKGKTDSRSLSGSTFDRESLHGF